MKFAIDVTTKEHRVYDGGPVKVTDVFVDADADGWIKNPGHGCPVPDGVEIYCKYSGGECAIVEHPEDMGWSLIGSQFDIIAYRPILADTSRRPGRTIAFIPPTERNVFDRLREAAAAAESIPGIIKEIDELLAPAGYCVARRQAEQAQDRLEWQAGDVLLCERSAGAIVSGKTYTVFRLLSDGVIIEKDENGDRTAWRCDFFRWIERPQKKERTRCTI